MVNSVVDNFLFKVPGLNIILEAFHCTPGTVDTCADLLSQGRVLGLAPGGVYEAQFGDHEYKILWRNRLGFAKAALKANVPILPVFTENIREAFRVLPFGGNFFYWLFQKTRLPLRPFFGGMDQCSVKIFLNLTIKIFLRLPCSAEDSHWFTNLSRGEHESGDSARCY